VCVAFLLLFAGTSRGCLAKGMSHCGLAIIYIKTYLKAKEEL